jgi:hypothetical protein
LSSAVMMPVWPKSPKPNIKRGCKVAMRKVPIPELNEIPHLPAYNVDRWEHSLCGGLKIMEELLLQLRSDN